MYNKFAGKGSRGYSEEKFDAPHYEGEKTPEGMREWVSYYGFVKKDDAQDSPQLDEDDLSDLKYDADENANNEE